jgi:hypothetical protein
VVEEEEDTEDTAGTVALVAVLEIEDVVKEEVEEEAEGDRVGLVAFVAIAVAVAAVAVGLQGEQGQAVVGPVAVLLEEVPDTDMFEVEEADTASSKEKSRPHQRLRDPISGNGNGGPSGSKAIVGIDLGNPSKTRRGSIDSMTP